MPGPADPDAPGPRSLLVMLAVYAGLTIAVVTVSTIAGVPAREPRSGYAEPEAGALAFFGPLASGERFEGWGIEQVVGRRAGGQPLVLRGPAGQRVEVELRPLDARSPAPPARSETLALYVHGGATTPEALAGVRALAGALRSREAAGARLVGLEPESAAR